MRVICGHCQNPIEVTNTNPRDEICCVSCGAAFHLAEEPPEWLPGEQLGKFELLELAGVGAYGAAYKARDLDLHQIVVIKVPRGGSRWDEQEFELFFREAHLLAELRHPSIVTVFEAAACENVPFLVCELVEGLTLADLLEIRRPTPHEAARIIADVADALQHAHQHGIFHSDITPSNIVLEKVNGVCDAEEGSSFPRRTRLMDFHPHRRETGEVLVTVQGRVLGCPACMSPEQVRGDLRRIDARSDLYSLGVILYLLLTGELPFRGTSRMLFQQVLHEDPQPPRKLNDCIPKELQTICLKAMAKEPSKRYQNAAHLASDLRRFLNFEPIFSHPEATQDRFQRWCRRNPRIAYPTAAAAMFLLLLAVVALWSALWLRYERDAALAQLQASQGAQVVLRTQISLLKGELEGAEHDVAILHKERDVVRDDLWKSYLTQAQANRQGERVGRRFESLTALARAAKIRRELRLNDDRDLELRNEAIEWLARPDLRKAETWRLPPDASARAFDATLEHCACNDGKGNLSILRVADGTHVWSPPGPSGPAFVVRYSPDGRFVATADHAENPKLLRVWDTQEDTVVQMLDRASFGHGCDFSPDSRKLALGRPDGAVYLCDLPTLKAYRIPNEIRQPTTLLFHPGGRKLAIGGSQPPVVEIRDLYSEQVSMLPRHAAPVRSLAWSRDGRLLAVGCDNGDLYVWDVANREALRVLKGHEARVVQVAFNSAADLLASCGADGTSRLWQTVFGRQVLSNPQGAGETQFSFDQGRLALGRDATQAWLWQVVGDECRTIFGHKDLSSIDISPDGRFVVCAGGRDGFRLCDLSAAVEGNNQIVTNQIEFVPQGGCLSAVFHPSGRSVLTSTPDGVHEWPLERDTKPSTFVRSPRTKLATGCAFLRLDGRTTAVLPTACRKLECYSGSSSHLDCEIESPQLNAPLSSVSISYDGEWIATGSKNEPVVRIWKSARNTRRPYLDVSAGPGAVVAFSPSGPYLVIDTGREYQLRKLGTWELEQQWAKEGEERGGGSIAFSSDGRMLAVRFSPTVLKLINTRTRQELASLPTGGASGSICFSPDGARLFAVIGNSAVQVWDLREVRRQLRQINLDWDLPPYSPANAAISAKPLRRVAMQGASKVEK